MTTGRINQVCLTPLQIEIKSGITSTINTNQNDTTLKVASLQQSILTKTQITIELWFNAKLTFKSKYWFVAWSTKLLSSFQIQYFATLLKEVLHIQLHYPESFNIHKKKLHDKASLKKHCQIIVRVNDLWPSITKCNYWWKKTRLYVTPWAGAENQKKRVWAAKKTDFVITVFYTSFSCQLMSN